MSASESVPAVVGSAIPHRSVVWAPVEQVGKGVLVWLRIVSGILVFVLITLRAGLRRRTAVGNTHGLVREQVYRAGVRLLPLAGLTAFLLGVVILGQGLVLLDRLGAEAYVGRVMIGAVVRELGPLTVAMLVLARVGAANVIDLGLARANGDLERLQSEGADPWQHLVVPRVMGMVLGVFALTIFFLVATLASGYGYAFVQNAAITPGEFERQLFLALHWQDFPLLAAKCVLFGTWIAATTCYQGLARPLPMSEFSRATSRALVQSVVGCVLVDLAFVAVYLVILAG